MFIARAMRAKDWLDVLTARVAIVVYTFSFAGCAGGMAAGPKADSGSGTAFDGGCAPIPDGSVLYASPAAGMVSGDELSAVLCPGWGSAVIKGSGSGSTPFVFTLGSVDFQFDSPSGATNGILSVSAGLSAAASGDFSSPAGQECGAVGFTYYLPAPPSVDCGGGAPPSCPLGCTSACSHFGCTPCAPKMPSVSYAAQGSSDCTGNTQTPVGSWHLTLTSVTMR